MKNMVIVVDMQNGFSRYEQTKALEKRIVSILNRDIFDVVIATKFLNNDNSVYEKMLGWKRLKNDIERSLPDEILCHVDYVLEKYIYNCVNSNFIQRLCQLNDGEYPEKIFIMGADTDCCVLTIATTLFENNIRPIVLTHYCSSNGGLEQHQAGILCLKRLIGEKQLSDLDPKSKEELELI